MTTPDPFGFKLSNVPLINLRQEFNEHHKLLFDDAFRELFKAGEIIRPVPTPYLIWGGMPGGFLTLALQRAFSGVESYIVGAVKFSLTGAALVSQRVSTGLSNPFSLGGRGVVENYYHELPALASTSYSLKNADPVLWAKTKAIYRDVRNPVFHGSEVDNHAVAGVSEVFDHLADMYRWIDGWWDPRLLWPGWRLDLRPQPRSGAT